MTGNGRGGKGEGEGKEGGELRYHQQILDQPMASSTDLMIFKRQH
jgi:hypothetical protein